MRRDTYKIKQILEIGPKEVNAEDIVEAFCPVIIRLWNTRAPLKYSI
jgi:hypothetical protein